MQSEFLSLWTGMPGKMSPTILVVGGGFAGRASVRYFLGVVETANIILVDQKPFFEFTPSVLRCIVHPEHLRLVTFQQNTDPEISFLRGKVTYITGHEATVVRRDDDRVTVFSIPFDYCIWATGVQYAQPISLPAWQHNPTLVRRRGEFSYFRHRVMSATEYVWEILKYQSFFGFCNKQGTLPVNAQRNHFKRMTDPLKWLV